MRKRIYIYRGIILLVGLLLFGPAKSQNVDILNLPTFDNRDYHFGFYLGINQMLYTIKTNTDFENEEYTNEQFPEIKKEIDWAKVSKIGSAPTLGFTIGIISDFRLGKYFDLRFTPDLQFGERVLIYNIDYKAKNNVAVESEEFQKRVSSTFLNFPFAIKYKGMRMHNVRPYLTLGARYSMDLGAQASKTIEGNEQNITIKLFRDDIYAEAGVGFDFYFNWFKMSTELKMSYGLKDVLLHEDNIWVGPIERLNSKLFQFNVTFE